MNIYLISQNVRNSYDTYDSAVVVAKDEDEARRLHPRAIGLDAYEVLSPSNFDSITWANSPEQVKVEYIGRADASFDKPQVIVASFNAG